MSRPAPTVSSSADDTEEIGHGLADRLLAGDVVLLEGDLAAGKTTLVRGLVRGLGGDQDQVTSPSFVLLQTYDCACGRIARLHHIDLYRVADRLGDLREVGIGEVLSDPEAVAAVEWPRRRLATWMPRDARLWRVRITTAVDDTRSIEIIAPST